MVHTLVEVQDVTLTYHEPHAETLAVEDLSFSVKKGEFVSIVGPSGCGKTSVLSLLAGLIKPSLGNIVVNENTETSKQTFIGYMLQNDSLLDWRTIESNVLLGLEVKRLLNHDSREFALRLLDRYGLSEFTNHYPSQLSGGMRQKVALIRTMAFFPELLLLDEPFSALDFQTRLKVSDEIYGIIRGEHKTAVLVTHDISEAIAMSDRVLVFTSRPARVKSEHIISLKEQTPLERRNSPEFGEYFKRIWKEMEND